MGPSTTEQTLFVPQDRGSSVFDRATTGLPSDLVNRAAARLQILAWLYASMYFMAAFFPAFLMPGALSILFGRAVNWLPGAISITVGVAVALALRLTHLRPTAVAV